MTQQEELIKLPTLLAEKEQIIANQEQLILKQQIQIDNMTGTAPCKKKDVWSILREIPYGWTAKSLRFPSVAGRGTSE